MKITQPAQPVPFAQFSGGSSFDNSGGLLPPGTDTVQEAIDAIIAGGLSGYLTTILGGQGVIQDLSTLGATETIDLANANYFYGTLDQDCTISFTGWTTGKDSEILVEVTEDGSGGWTPTFSGVSWLGGTPTHDTTAATVTLYGFLSRDGGTTIYGFQAGSGGSSGNFLTVIDGGGGTVFPHGNLGSTETIDTANGNYHWGTLNANCTFTFSTIADTAERWFTLELIEDGTGTWTVTWPGSVTWLGGTTPTHTTTAGTTTIYSFFTRNGGTNWVGGQLGAGGSGSPLTTKGDLFTFSTVDARLAVGTNDYLLRADSTQTTGLEWVDPQNAGHWEVLMDGSTPPNPLDDGATDWLYAWVPGV
jgi:hypothetical protein